MDAKDVLALGLGVMPPWRLADQGLDRSKRPHVLEILLETERGAEFPCPECKRPCKAHDFKDFTWRHLNFFQHHCLITARVPRTDCPEHGVKRVQVPWAREGSGFTLLFEQAAMTLVREMPVLAVARFIGITDKRLWRVVEYYVAKALRDLDLSGLTAVAFDAEGIAFRPPRGVTTPSPCSSTRTARASRWSSRRRARARRRSRNSRGS